MSSQTEAFTKEQIAIENLGQLVLIGGPINLTKLDREGEGIIVTDLGFDVNNFGELIENSDAVPIVSKNSVKRLIYFAPGVVRKIILGVDPVSILKIDLSGDNSEKNSLYLNIWQAAVYRCLNELKESSDLDMSPKSSLEKLYELWRSDVIAGVDSDESDFVQKVRKLQDIISRKNKEDKKEQHGKINSIEELFKSLDISPEDLPVSEEELENYFLEQMNLEEHERKLDSGFYKAMDLLRKNAVFQRDGEGNLIDKINHEAISTYLALLHVLGEENMGEFLGTFLQEKGFNSIADINQRIFSYVNGLDDNERAVLKNEIKNDVDSIRNETVEAKVDLLLDQWRAESRTRGIKIDLNVALASLDVPVWLKNKIREELHKRGLVAFYKGDVILDGRFRPTASEKVDTNALSRLAELNPKQNEKGPEEKEKRPEIMDEARNKLRESTYADIRMRADVEKAKRAFEAAKRSGSKKEQRKKYQEWKAKYREWKEWAEKTGKENFTRHLPPEVAHLIQNEKVSFERRRVYQLSEMVQQDFAAIQAYSIFMRDKDGKTVVSRENVVKYLALLHVLDFYYGRTGSNVLANINVARWYEGLNEAEKAKLLLDVTARVAQYRGSNLPQELVDRSGNSVDEIKKHIKDRIESLEKYANLNNYFILKQKITEKKKALSRTRNKNRKLNEELKDLEIQLRQVHAQIIQLKLLKNLSNSLELL